MMRVIDNFGKQSFVGIVTHAIVNRYVLSLYLKTVKDVVDVISDRRLLRTRAAATAKVWANRRL